MKTPWGDIVSSILRPLLELDPRLAEGLEGCSPGDIAVIERKFDLVLPEAFQELLKLIGRKRGALFPGADFGYPELLGYRDIADSLLEEDNGLSLHSKDFVYEMHQGYQFFYFRAESGDDPPVYLYDGDEPRFLPLDLSFTAWLKVCVEEEVGLWRSALDWEAKGHRLERLARDASTNREKPLWWKL